LTRTSDITRRRAVEVLRSFDHAFDRPFTLGDFGLEVDRATVARWIQELSDAGELRLEPGAGYVFQRKGLA